MRDISKEVFTKIKEQGIVPRTKAYFIFKRSTVWILFGLSVILGSVAGSAVIFKVRNADWDLFQHFRSSLLEFALLYIPYFWGLFMIVFSVIAYYYFRRTQSGYRYRAATIVALSLFLSVIGGMGIYAAGISERMESAFEKRLPFYRGVAFHNRMVWMSPDKGLLAGKISDVSKTGIILLKDLDDNEWLVDAKGAVWRARLNPYTGLEVKLIGVRTGRDSFRANEVRPWHGKKKHGAKGRRNRDMIQSFMPEN